MHLTDSASNVRLTACHWRHSTIFNVLNVGVKPGDDEGTIEFTVLRTSDQPLVGLNLLVSGMYILSPSGSLRLPFLYKRHVRIPREPHILRILA